jgi:hypothetical protein
MTPPALILSCCRCGKRLPQAKDVYVLDDEWARRYPRMTGRIACYDCSLGTEWTCRAHSGKPSADTAHPFVAGHIASAFAPPDRDFDSWSHISPPSTLKAAARKYPEHAITQGGEAYIRWVVQRYGGGDSADPAAALRAIQAEWSP